MKLRTVTQVTLDGVMQGNGGATEEDRRSGFDRGSWALGLGDDSTHAHINETYERAIALYESMGFNEIGRRPNYYPAKRGREDAVVMAMEMLGDA